MTVKDKQQFKTVPYHLVNSWAPNSHASSAFLYVQPCVPGQMWSLVALQLLFGMEQTWCSHDGTKRKKGVYHRGVASPTSFEHTCAYLVALDTLWQVSQAIFPVHACMNLGPYYWWIIFQDISFSVQWQAKLWEMGVMAGMAHLPIALSSCCTVLVKQVDEISRCYDM